MSKTNPAVLASGIAAGVLGVGYFVARMGSSHPVGDKIPDERRRLTAQAAQSETIKAGKGDAYSAREVDVKRKGGDQGIKASSQDKIVDVTKTGMGER